jgi:lambda repressor-like predicted transcriptional regulator
MICCYGLAYSDPDDVRSLIPNSNIVSVLPSTNVKIKKGDLVCVYGIKTLSRSKELFEKTSVRVLVMDALVRFRGYSIAILDSNGSLDQETLKTALNTKTKKVVFQKPENVIHTILLDAKSASFLNNYMRYRFSLTGDKRKQFDLDIYKYLNSNSKKYDGLFLEGLAKKMLIDIEKGTSLAKIASKYKVEQYDLQYMQRLKSKAIGS